MTKHFSPGSGLRVIVTTGQGANPGPTGPTVTFGEPLPSVDAGVSATVSDVSPDKTPAEGGTRVVITGTGFTGATAVAFGTSSQKIPARFTVDSDSQITATTPDSTKSFTPSSDLEVFVTTRAGPSRRAGDHIPTVTFGEPLPSTLVGGAAAGGASSPAGPQERKLEKLDRDGDEPSGPQPPGKAGNLLGTPGSAATWTPPSTSSPPTAARMRRLVSSTCSASWRSGTTSAMRTRCRWLTARSRSSSWRSAVLTGP